MSRSPTPLQIQRAIEREQRAQEKARLEAYRVARESEAQRLNAQISNEMRILTTLLEHTLKVDDYISIDSLKEKAVVPDFAPGAWAKGEPRPDSIVPSKPGLIGSLLPGAKRKHEVAVAAAQAAHEEEVAAWTRRETHRQQLLAEAELDHQKRLEKARLAVQAQHEEIETFKTAFEASDPHAVAKYFSLVLEASHYPAAFPKKVKIAYVPESKQLVVERDLPTQDVIPAIREYKYVRSGDKINELSRPQTERRALYASALAQMALRTLHEVFEADRTDKLETVILNAYCDTIDKATGRPVRPCLITVRTTRSTFMELNLANVDPATCLKKLSASVSANAYELAPVRPVLEFSMVDPRFIEETDVLSQLDSRPNLMELTPGEFESLITNLFEKMGLETRLTQASRDGGVDCVAYDSRPIFGGKVVIQAKRYKHTVGVSAVRDLFGTVQNEGASKGILVTTSGYGAASFEFAENKPLELLSGSHLLHLLAEHAGMEARIEAPEGWKDPVADAVEIVT